MQSFYVRGFERWNIQIYWRRPNADDAGCDVPEGQKVVVE